MLRRESAEPDKIRITESGVHRTKSGLLTSRNKLARLHLLFLKCMPRKNAENQPEKQWPS